MNTCINEFNKGSNSFKISEPVKKNLEFFMKLRNKIQHRHINKRDIDVLIFGECQALLNNFESTLNAIFGDDYSINESLVYSLQFSHLRTHQQQEANKGILSKEIQYIRDYVTNFRTSIDDIVFSSQEYSIKLIQIPKISNTNRSDLAIEFVRWDELSPQDKEAYEKVTTLIKDKLIKIEAANVGKLKPSDVVNLVNNALQNCGFNMSNFVMLYKLFQLRPSKGSNNPSDTIPKYCLYDEAHRDYVYLESFPNLIIKLFQSNQNLINDIKTVVLPISQATFKIVPRLNS